MPELEFNDKYFDKECREGFIVSEVMKRCWAAQLEVLNDVDNLCKKHGIKWFADWGTLLGAIRHKGFIPWDDDIDIAMLKDDYIKFMYYAKLELDNKYKILNVYTEGEWGMTFCRIVNGEGLVFEKNFLEEWHGCPILVGLDVFPYYYLPRNEEEEKKQLDMLEVIAAIKSVNEYAQKKKDEGKTKEFEELNLAIAENMVLLEKRTGYLFETDKTLNEQLDILSEQIMRFYDEVESDYVTQYCYYLNDRSFYMKKEWFSDTIEMPFENIKVCVPCGYEEILKTMYGDWQTPVRNFAGHGYPYFDKQIRVMKNELEKRELIILRKNLTDNSLNIPQKQDLKNSKNEKCTILMYTGIREMLIYSEYVIDKIKMVIDYCKNNIDKVTLYWIPSHFDLDKSLYLNLVVPQLINEYNQLILEYKNQSIGICDESGDIAKAIDCCDCFYGDESFLSDLFKLTGKPVMIQDYRLQEI